MEHNNMPGFLVYVFLGLILIALTVGIFLSLNDFYYELGLRPTGVGDEVGWNIDKGIVGTTIDKKDSKTADDNIVNLTGDFVRAEVRFMDGYVMTKRLSGCVYHKDTGMFEVSMIQVSGKSAVYYVAPENLILINMTDDIDKMGE